MYLYHYTSRELAQNIYCLGKLLPGLSGNIYLTTDLYAIGTEASQKLAIEGKPVELAFSLPDSNIKIYVSKPRRVQPLRGPKGVIRRKGGGLELTISRGINIVNETIALSLREP